MEERVHYLSFVCDSARWDSFEFREDDIVVSTAPKCGTTWMQMILALLVFQQPEPPTRLSRLSPWLDMLTAPLDEILELLAAQTHRRFIKTHTPLDGVPWDRRVTYLTVNRDPRDVAFSFGHHMRNLDMERMAAARRVALGGDGPAIEPRRPMPDDPIDGFRWWVDNDEDIRGLPASLRYVTHHANTFWGRRHEQNVVFAHYGDLLRDLPGEMRLLADALGIEIDDDTIESLAPSAEFTAMKEHADLTAPNTDRGIWRDNTDFFPSGPTRSWRDVLDDASLEHYESVLQALVDDDLIAWLHGGRSAASP